MLLKINKIFTKIFLIIVLCNKYITVNTVIETPKEAHHQSINSIKLIDINSIKYQSKIQLTQLKFFAIMERNNFFFIIYLIFFSLFISSYKLYIKKENENLQKIERSELQYKIQQTNSIINIVSTKIIKFLNFCHHCWINLNLKIIKIIYNFYISLPATIQNIEILRRVMVFVIMTLIPFILIMIKIINYYIFKKKHYIDFKYLLPYLIMEIVFIIYIFFFCSTFSNIDTGKYPNFIDFKLINLKEYNTCTIFKTFDGITLIKMIPFYYLLNSFLISYLNFNNISIEDVKNFKNSVQENKKQQLLITES